MTKNELKVRQIFIKFYNKSFARGCGILRKERVSEILDIPYLEACREIDELKLKDEDATPK